MSAFLVKLVIVSLWSFCFYKIGYHNRILELDFEKVLKERIDYEVRLASLIKEAHELKNEKGKE
jgi:hypothetical protein